MNNHILTYRKALELHATNSFIVKKAHAIHDYPQAHENFNELDSLRFHAYASRIFFYNHREPTYFSFKAFLLANWDLTDDDFIEALWERMTYTITKKRTLRPSATAHTNARTLLDAFTEKLHKAEPTLSLSDCSNAYQAILASSLNGILAERTVVKALEARDQTVLLASDEHEREDIDLFFVSPKKTLIPISVKTGKKFDNPAPRPTIKNWRSSLEIERLRFTEGKTAPAIYITTDLRSKTPTTDSLRSWDSSDIAKAMTAARDITKQSPQNQRRYRSELERFYATDPERLALLRKPHTRHSTTPNQNEAHLRLRLQWQAEQLLIPA